MLQYIPVVAALTLSIGLPVVGNAQSNVIRTSGGELRVSEGFTIERAAASPIVQHPMMAGFDGRGRLFIAAAAGKNLRTADLEKELPNFIRMIEDTDGDGVFDKSTIFADKMTLPMGALWYRDSLYVAAPPNIWRLQDTDDDGIADKREILVDKFGYSGNAASVHGPFLHPSGRIFWCDGRHGHEFKDADGNVIEKMRGSGIFSMLPDGSDVQMFCGGGMDNPVEVDFWPSGEVIGSVNILYTGPRIDCMVHWQDGGVYPHQAVSIAEFKRTGDLLGPITKFGHVAVSGMMRYRSTALGEDFQNSIFTTIFNTGKLIRSKLRRSGSTFVTEESEFLTSTDPDIHPTDVLEDADGSLLVIDTGGWFRIGCPTSQIAKPDIHGAIYRIRRANAPLVDDPRGQTINFEDANNGRLLSLLSDPRPAVQEKAIEAASQRDGFTSRLYQYLVGKSYRTVEHQTGRQNAIWSLARRGGGASPSLASIAGRKTFSPEIRIAAATAAVAGHDRLQINYVAINNLTNSYAVASSAAVRTALARMLGTALQLRPDIVRSESDERLAAEVTTELLERIGNDLAFAKSEPTDREAEHAAIYAAIRISSRAGLLQLLEHEIPTVRRSALIALDQMDDGNPPRESVVALLDTDDEELHRATLDVISRHEGWASDTAALLKDWLTQSDLTNERVSVARGFLSVQSNDESIQNLIAELLQKEDLPNTSRQLLLEVITTSGLKKLPADWTPLIAATLKSDDANHRRQAVKICAAFETDAFDSVLVELASDQQERTATRIEALATTAARRPSVADTDLQFLLGNLSHETDPLTQIASADALAELSLNAEQRHVIADAIASAGPLTIRSLLSGFAGTSNTTTLRKLVASLTESPAAATLRPADLAPILEQAPDDERSALQTFINSLSSSSNESALNSRLQALVAGDAVKGRELFFSRAAACSTCHAISGKGSRVGPDLSKIGAIRRRRDLVEAVMFPSASFARGYNSWSIITEDGRVRSGLITRETADALTLKQSNLTEVRIPRSEIDQMTPSQTSIMPEGLSHRLSDQQLSDLVAYLEGLK